jgi:diguanylate cyclase (GGDEF)-like protein
MPPDVVGEAAVTPRSVRSRIFDALVVESGAVLAAVAVAMVAWDGAHLSLAQLFDIHTVKLWTILAVPLIVMMGYFPMLIGRTGGGIEIGLESCVLIFLANVSTPWEALVVWLLGTTIAQLLSDKRRATKAFNSGLGVIAGGLALLVISLTRADRPATLPDLLAMGLGAAVYFAVDFFLSAISLSLQEGTSLRQEVVPTGALEAFVSFLAISSLGYLAALVVYAMSSHNLQHPLPLWSAVLLAVPVMTILVASRALSRGGELARRLKVLFDTVVQAQSVKDRGPLLDVLRVGAGDLLHDHRVTLRATAPGSHEIGVLVPGGDEPQWIVAPALNRARSTAKDDQAGLAALVVVAEDALARLRLSDAMAHQAWHDPLTGLPNRSLFMDRVAHAMELQRRRGGHLAVLFCDLDGFKRVNDSYGHAAGDNLLTEVGRRIKGAVRETDTVARLGGDEFAVLLEEVSDPSEVELACDRILTALRSRFNMFGEAVSVTTTIGVAMSETGGSADSLLSQADLAMYHAKSQGKNRYETYRLSFGDQRSRRIEFVENLRAAVETKSLEVYYQPVVDLHSHMIVGVEALVRWRRDGVLVPPDLFIPTSEESGLIVGLGDIVLDIVTADAPELVAAAGRTLSIAVNVSAQQLESEGFVERVQRALQAMGGVHLTLEVTERDFVNNDPRTLAAMKALAASDVRFAIDDFGVGFSSMEYLQRLPVRILKVDKTFVANIEHDSKACTLVRSMVVMGEALGLDVIVEGIERWSQLEHVTFHAGATTGQGYLFGRPMPCPEIVQLLSASIQTWPARPDAGALADALSHIAASTVTHA